MLKYDLQQNFKTCLKGRKKSVFTLTVCMDPNLYLVMWVLEWILCTQSVILAPSYRGRTTFVALSGRAQTSAATAIDGTADKGSRLCFTHCGHQQLSLKLSVGRKEDVPFGVRVTKMQCGVAGALGTERTRCAQRHPSVMDA